VEEFKGTKEKEGRGMKERNEEGNAGRYGDGGRNKE
jgi:hypothetical protein